MYKGKKILAIVPARGGSKGIPGKNIRPFCGRPLIAWTIREARLSRYIDTVAVSTDSRAIADIARRSGAEVPFLRPERLATDTASGIDAVMHAMNWFTSHDRAHDVIIVLQPTSPLRLACDIDGAIRSLLSRRSGSIISVTELDHSLALANTLPKNGSMERFISVREASRNRGKLPVYYMINGAVYAAYACHLEKSESFFGKGSRAYIMPRERSVDIDTQADFNYAEYIKRGRR